MVPWRKSPSWYSALLTNCGVFLAQTSQDIGVETNRQHMLLAGLYGGK